ncbi:hypothetical protein EFK50_01050 [Nocardioides marmoriginsengisoli]|uniref:HK97 gp10 family phage protein n=1 Tax=Nocardioides marmoriginsengisoli TaxID=661483 RepID=A0A3N0CRZ0_9ACTN|nr:hypothetical protein [Nocardioides marmoriginsengisoli]RNL66244.1 hypothetical protein EFK50_01050 [Nocardioides marmoriginsengisoli]
MQVRVRHSIDDLASDLASIPVTAAKDMVRTVREGLKVGNSVARDFARRSSGAHGKLYDRAFSTEMHGTLSALTGGGLISGEYGPDASKAQGDMSFEYGSRNQKPHLDLARSADLIGATFAHEVGELPDRWFW